MRHPLVRERRCADQEGACLLFASFVSGPGARDRMG